MLRNALACFRAQDYPRNRCELIIIDDAGQFTGQAAENWRLVSSAHRYPTLPRKFNALLAESRGDLVAVWEDDDIFLPWNLADTARAFRRDGAEFLTPASVWSNYGRTQGQLGRDDPRGRFHSSWRFSRAIAERVGGYPDSGRLSFDQEFAAKLRSAGTAGIYGEPQKPSYVYRWGSGGWNGSQHGDGEDFAAFWESLASLPAPAQPALTPVMDEETLLVFCNYGA